MKLAAGLVPSSYISQGDQALRSHRALTKQLLEQKKMPIKGWSSETIELLLNDLSLMDSNNFPGNVGAGEREARIICPLVARRHYNLGHGIGRSGDIAAVQPKAAGSSVMMRLTNLLVTDVLRQAGVPATAASFVVPMATGMALVLCMLTLRSSRPEARYVVWSRIDQKSCFKSIMTAGFIPVIIPLLIKGDELCTDVAGIQAKLAELGHKNVLCVLTTTSCFAPRVPDSLVEVAEECKKHDVPHIVNNAYGVQLSACCHLLQQAQRIGRVDAFVQSCDKNFMVPVGGAVIAGFSSEFIELIAKTYPGRASSDPTMDMFMTLLSLGSEGYSNLLAQRKDVYKYLKQELSRVAEKYGLAVLHTPHNPISLAMSLTPNKPAHTASVTTNSDTTLCQDKTNNVDNQPPEVADAANENKHGDSIPNSSTSQGIAPVMITQLGSMLFTRNISGARVVALGENKEIGGHHFTGFGSHHDQYPFPYLTLAAAIGMTRDDVDTLLKKLDKVIKQWQQKCQKYALTCL